DYAPAPAALTADLKYSSDSRKPVCKSILGSQPSSFLAFLMSGQRCFGSSWGRAWKRTLLLEPVTSSTTCAHPRMVNSPGLPMLVGSRSSDFDNPRIPATSSLTKQ